jgi:hypothetical protein
MSPENLESLVMSPENLETNLESLVMSLAANLENLVMGLAANLENQETEKENLVVNFLRSDKR